MPKPQLTLQISGLQVLVVLNVTMSLVALTVDWQAIQAVPAALIPFIVICPIYPFLLALIWMHKLHRRTIPLFLQAALLPTATYGVLAPLYYVTHSFVTVFSWNDMGQIGWVLLYAGQAMYLLLTTKMSRAALFWGGCFSAVSLCLQFVTKSYGYLAINDLSQPIQILFLVVGLLVTLGWHQVSTEISENQKAH